ncbi:hypothetical protein DEU56DRAFT_449562, partial [Suillus clintonianus]|uniref:uncharacterized protein n=1 Tax=Suillus clintonianus TaxID=1904413 RepID=UPI001B871DA6
EKSLAQAYSFVRAGRLDEVVQLCRKAHQSWRAASIRGSLLLTINEMTLRMSKDGRETHENCGNQHVQEQS